MSYQPGAPYPPTSHPYAAPTPPHDTHPPAPQPLHSPYPPQPAHYHSQPPFHAKPPPQHQPQPYPPAPVGYGPPPGAAHGPPGHAHSAYYTHQHPNYAQQQSPQQNTYPQYPQCSTHYPHPQPQPQPGAIDPAAAAAEELYQAELRAYRRQLAEYYYKLALQGQMGPAEGDEQLSARAQGLEWAKAHGVNFSPARTAAGQVQPLRRVSLPPQTLAGSPPQSAQPPAQLAQPATQQNPHPLPPPARTGSAPIRPGSVSALPPRPMSTGTESSSVGRASPAAPSQRQETGGRSFTPTGQRGPLPTAPARPSSVGSRPALPAVPASAARRPSVPTVAIPRVQEVDGLAEKVAAVTIKPEATSAGVPSFSFAGPDDQPQPAQPKVHPRDDPSHPSHPLYHPAARLPALEGGAVEAGTVSCRACGETLFGRVISTLGESWHPACFVCMEDGCGQNLEHVQFEGRDGAVYCMVHFEERYARECYQCKTPIADPDYLTLSDPALPPEPRYYHALHFFCSNCGDPFVDPSSLSKGEQHTLARPYMVHDGWAYCEQCEVRIFRDKCTACGEGIPGDYTEAGEGVYHPHCFNCTDCQKPLTGQYLLRTPAPGEQPTTSSPKKPALARNKKKDPEQKPYCHACFERRALDAADARAREAVRG